MTTRTDHSTPASPKQVRAIHAQRRTLGLDDATYRLAIAGYACYAQPPLDTPDWPAYGTPCRSSTHLTRSQARALITRWSIAGARVGGPYSGSRRAAQEQTAAGVPALPTPAQRAIIARLIPEIAWRRADGYHAWLATRLRQDPHTAPRTYQDAEAIIDGLKALLRHGHAHPAA